MISSAKSLFSHFKNCSHYLLILVFVLVNHGLLLLNDGVYWDGWLIYTYHLEDKQYLINKMFTEAGAPVALLLHRTMGYFPNIIFGYKLVAFLSLFLVGIFTYRIFIKLTIFNQQESIIIALINVSYPAFQVYFELIILPYIVLYACFLGGIVIFIDFTKVPKYQFSFKRLVCLALLFISFSVNSLLVFYFAFISIALFLHSYQDKLLKKSLSNYLSNTIYFIKNYLDFIVLPFAFFIFTRTFFPVHGLYENYNTITFSWDNFKVAMAAFVKASIINQLFNVLTVILDKPIVYLLLSVLIVTLIFKKKYMKRLKVTKQDSRRGFFIQAVFGIFLLFTAIFPYAAVGKYPSTYGWNTRMALLLGLPLGVITTSLMNLASFNKLILRTFLSLLTVALLSFTSLNIQNYIIWQARWITDRSIMLNLAEIQEAKQVSIFWIDDKITPVSKYKQYYSFYEWSSIFEQVWGDESRIGFNKQYRKPNLLSEAKNAFNERYNLSNFNPLGKQACLIIDSGAKKYSHNQLFIRYFFNKTLSKSHLNRFLKKVTSLKLDQSKECTYHLD